MNFAGFISSRITFKSKRTFSKLIVRIAIIGIMLGLGVMILSLAVIRGFKQEIREKVRGFAGDIQIVRTDNNTSFDRASFTDSAAVVKNIKSVIQVDAVYPYATKPGIIKANNEIEGVVLKGVDKTYNWDYVKKMLVAGTVIQYSDTAAVQTQIMISQLTANRLRLKTGDDVMMYFVQEPLRKRKLKIVGIFSIGVDEVDKTFVIGDLALIKRLNDWSHGEIGGYEVRTADFNKIISTANNIDDKLPIKLKSYTVLENYPTIFGWLDMLDVNIIVMLVLMIAVAVINMISALLIMILERTSMIGIFKAMGAGNWMIQKIFLYNATYLIGVGLVLGNALGLGVGYFQQQTNFFKLDQASYYMAFVPIRFIWADVLWVNAGTLIVCLLVLIVPSMLVTRIQPVKAIRFK
ncbi:MULTISPECIES: FtsX-like permease family protein [unclassified Mucilaginibacter]|uniref:ABC transporter permease n=1 Tax=unclassified Mucilaginibacter TaxID=2617802 RepID=UPI002AC8B8BD|nr:MULTISPECIES: FtsX-like permease family protein [unclassified Mucilaginibacter]MEB0261455.1 ABC transporter permease [Mucilaginibacter sp. 10I4]MEB0276959.1 ABC transporter permease [Mucilaginibacter sp. 10B2]MEB0301518.1 ABC transporter permease [Mucilaginibacter sp. 5C4]WPX25059.1 FtsX-like permease family protein [Mucilaginibacter sp. 5C4]